MVPSLHHNQSQHKQRHHSTSHYPLTQILANSKMVVTMNITSVVDVVANLPEEEQEQETGEFMDFESNPGAPSSGSGCVIV